MAKCLTCCRHLHGNELKPKESGVRGRSVLSSPPQLLYSTWGWFLLKQGDQVQRSRHGITTVELTRSDWLLFEQDGFGVQQQNRHGVTNHTTQMCDFRITLAPRQHASMRHV